jgi:hypothetical protein
MGGGTTWVKGLSGRGSKRAPRGDSLVELIKAVGEERVPYPAQDEDAASMKRREVLARVLWTRAIADGDLACAKLLIDCLDGKFSTGAPGRRDGQTITPEDLQAAEALLAEWWAAKAAPRDAAPELTEGRP